MRKIRKPDPRDGWYEITPSDAQRILDERAANRPLKEFRAQRIAADIAARRYRENGESVVFDERGKLLDGQHRLRGIVLANTPAITYCVFGVSASCFPTFDQGQNRSGADNAALMDFQNASAVAATARLALRYAKGTLNTTGHATLIPMDELTSYMKRNRIRLSAAVETVLKYRNGLVKLTPISHVAFVYYMNFQDDPGKALEFVESLATGAGLAKGDARLLFRQRMHDLAGQKHALTQEHKLALLIKTWNAYRTGEKVGVLRWRNDESFPKFVEVGRTQE